MSLTGYPEGPPARLPIAAIDLGTAMWASVGIQAALRTRDQTGEGGLVEVSLYETAAWWLSYLIAGYMGSGEEPQRRGSGAPFLAPYEVFATSDGDLMVTAANDDLFARLCDALGFPDLPTDPSYRQNADRVANRAALHDLLQARFFERPATEWHDLLRARSVPCTPVRSVADFVGRRASGRARHARPAAASRHSGPARRGHPAQPRRRPAHVAPATAAAR